MKVTVIGGGYIGLVSAICFCEFGFKIRVIEPNKKRYDNLISDDFSFWEAGVTPAIKKHVSSGLLSFSNDISNPVGQSDAVVIAVGTTSQNGPDSDLTTLNETVRSVALSLPDNRYVGIFIKTSVPVGTCTILSNNVQFIRPNLIRGEHYDIIANPEFLREGSAIHDFLNPKRIVIGTLCDSPKAKELSLKLYSSAVKMKLPILFSNFETAELIRAATVTFQAMIMAFSNEIADICLRSEADVNLVLKGITLSYGFPSNKLKVSPGVGGTTVPRAIRILQSTADFLGLDLELIKGITKSNSERVASIKDNIIRLIEDGQDLSTKRVAIWGLTFKPRTPDIRESASVFVINDLLNLGIPVYLHDPLFTHESKELYRIPQEILNDPNFHICESVYEASNQSDVVVIMTNWDEFASVDLSKIHELMNKKDSANPVILDYRNMFLKSDLPNFNYISQGAH